MTGKPIKVLFVSSGRNGRAGDVVLAQGESLQEAGVSIDYYLVRPGLAGYLSAIPQIRKRWKKGNYDLVHAHYSLSAITASLSGCIPLVVSLMGSDVYMSGFLRLVTRILYRYRWKVTIVKSVRMKEMLKMQEAEIVPNGVDINLFRPVQKEEVIQHIALPSGKKLIIFIAAPGRPEKNPRLAKMAISILGEPEIEFRQLYNIPRSEMPMWLNAADVLLLTSRWEGSPNVVKEAMACNCPVVATDVGDISYVSGNTKGCFITSFDAGDIAGKLRAVLDLNARTDGRERIKELELDSNSVAQKIISIYEKITNR